jgi:hypothetical protein
MKLFIFIIFSLVILYVKSVPVNCVTTSKHVLETQEVLNEDQSKGFRKFKRNSHKAKIHSKNFGKNFKKVGKPEGNKLGHHIKEEILGKIAAKGAVKDSKKLMKEALLRVHTVKYKENNLFKSTTNIPLSSLARKCQTADVCVVDCSKIIPGCKKPAFFIDFVNNVKESKKLEVFSAYLKACIKKEYDDPSESFWMRDALVKYVNEAKQFRTSAKVVVTAQLPFFKILEKIETNKQQLIPRYLKGMSELFLSFQKMCYQDPVSFKLLISSQTWKQQAEIKINQLLDGDVKQIEKQFNGDKLLIDYFSKILNDLHFIKKEFARISVGDASFAANFEKITRNFKNAFVEQLKLGELGYVCECVKFMHKNSAFPNPKGIARLNCLKVCAGRQPENILEEFYLDMDL